MKKLLLPLFCLCGITLFGQVQQTASIEWQKSLGGSGYEEAMSIIKTSDGGYIVAGSSTSTNFDVIGNHGDADYWIVKLDALGIISWQKSLGGTGYDVANSIQQTSDGGYIVAGTTNSNDGDITGNHGSYDYWVVKLQASGNILWQKTLGGSWDDQFHSLQQTVDGGYIVAGTTNSNDGDVTVNHGSYDYWILKLNSAGIIQWQKSLGGTDDDIATSIQQTTDGGYIVAGDSRSFLNVTIGEYDYWIVKLDALGNMTWSKTLGGSGVDLAYSIQQTSDGGYIVAGGSDSNDGDVSGNHGFNDYWIVKLNSLGTIQWQKSLGGSGEDVAYSIQFTCDNDIVIAGGSSSNNGDVSGNHCCINASDYWVVKLNITYAFSDTICQSTYNWNGQNYSQSGQYTQTLTNQFGCDSIVTLNLTINASVGYLDVYMCQGAVYTFNNQQYTEEGRYYLQTLQTQNGCDSIVYLSVSINDPGPTFTSNFNASICPGSYYSWNGQTYTQPGQYTQIFTTHGDIQIASYGISLMNYGCDSVVTLNLTTPSITSSFNATICPGATYTWNNQLYSQAGQYTQTLQNQNGCDSVVTLNLNIWPSFDAAFSSTQQLYTAPPFAV
jgi:hypothetical protein